MIKNLINQNAIFSFKVARGSVRQRTELTEKLVEKIYRGIQDYNTETNSDYITKDKFETIIHTKLPEDKSVKVQPIANAGKDTYEGFSDLDIDKNDNVLGHIIELNFRRKRFPLHDTFVFVHEMIHVLDKMINPKILTRMINISSKLNNNNSFGSDINKYNNLYDSLYGDSYEKFTNETEKRQVLARHKDSIKRFLAKRAPQEKIDILQNLRYQLWLELHAYTIENDYIEKMGKSNNVDTSSIKTKVDKYLFEEKINMIKELANKIIREERLKHKKKLIANSSEH